jgi:hypothetical protein
MRLALPTEFTDFATSSRISQPAAGVRDRVESQMQPITSTTERDGWQTEFARLAAINMHSSSSSRTNTCRTVWPSLTIVHLRARPVCRLTVVRRINRPIYQQEARRAAPRGTLQIPRGVGKTRSMALSVPNVPGMRMPYGGTASR